MGGPFFSRCSSTGTGPMPNPRDYEILDSYEVELNGGSPQALVVLIKYPGCTNFEGRKILVYQNCRLIDLIRQKEIDPHFTNDKTKYWPVARFIPTAEGWEMAQNFVQRCSIIHPYVKKAHKYESLESGTKLIER